MGQGAAAENNRVPIDIFKVGKSAQSKKVNGNRPYSPPGDEGCLSSFKTLFLLVVYHELYHGVGNGVHRTARAAVQPVESLKQIGDPGIISGTGQTRHTMFVGNGRSQHYN